MMENWYHFIIEIEYFIISIPKYIFYLYTQDTDKQKEISNMQQFDSGTKAVDAVS